MAKISVTFVMIKMFIMFYTFVPQQHHKTSKLLYVGKALVCCLGIAVCFMLHFASCFVNTCLVQYLCQIFHYSYIIIFDDQDDARKGMNILRWTYYEFASQSRVQTLLLLDFFREVIYYGKIFF